MTRLVIRSAGSLRVRTAVPGDKSISHRALLLGALAEGACEIEGFLPCNDCLSTLACVRALGIEVVSHTPRHLTVFGKGLRGLQAPAAPLHCHRSGTTMRLLIGILAGQTFGSALTGDGQLRRRPMDRVIEPLRSMGAKINLVDGAAAISIHGRPLHGQEHAPAVASAQLKSALLLAGLYADGPTVIRQPGPARDHTERMLLAMGAQLEITGLTVKLTPTSALSPCSIRIPGDLSSAAFPLVAATLVPDSQVTIVGVGSNPTRTGLLDVLQNMGGEVTIHRTRQLRNEPVTDVTIRTSTLHGVEIGGEIVVRMIDEFPALAVAATQALGVTVVRDAAELRTKETDRIRTIATGLAKMGARIEARPDGFVVAGPVPLHGAVVDSHGDHRLAMALVVAGLIAEGETTVNNAECVDDSFPGFVELMRQMGADISWQDG